ncbi:MAG: DNA glycosylase [Eubacteriaceae bacterium]|nr:DNA glycosylase [Eubacteriaceae bacterium]
MTYNINNIRDFNLDHIFDCGQCFRWEKQADGSYTGVAFGNVVNMSFAAGSKDDGRTNCDGTLTIKGAGEDDFNNIWRNYLDLDRDYGEIKRVLSEHDETMQLAIASGEGIRILKQDLWETIVSFIISQNNNIPRIKGCIEKLAENFGDEICYLDEQVMDSGAGNRRWFSLPEPQVLASLTVEDLEPVRLGYRAKYLIATAQTVCERGLPKNLEELSVLTGVGPKVANCINLFGLGDFSSFPIDVWVRRVMNRLYGIDENDMKSMAAFAAEKFGELGGIAQQYLFYYIRGL